MAMERKQKAATESLVLLVVIALICVAVNALGAFGLYARKDMTQAERYTLSQGSGRLLHSMKQKMVVDAYVTRGLPKLDAFVRDLRDLLQEYKTAGGGKFDYNLIEVKDDQKKKEEAEKEGLQPLQIAESESDEKAGVAQGYMGLVFKYGVEKDVIPVLSPDQTSGLEFWISNKIRDLRDKGDEIKHKVGVLTGDDEMKLSEPNLVPAQMGRPSMQDVISKNFPFYTFVDVDLKKGDQPIDDSLDGLIITQPGKDLTDKELRRIDEFVMKGKSLAVIASAVNMKEHDATMTGTLNLHNLDKLLEGYGIEMHKDVVLDFGRSFRVILPTQAGLASVRFPQILEIDDDTRFTGDKQLLDTSFPAVFRMKQVVMPFCSSLTLHKDKQPDASEFSVVARSTPHSIHKTDDSIELGLKSWRPKGEWQQFNVAARIEGRLKSAFPSGDKQGVDAASQVPSGKSARIFVLSSSQFTANPFARAGNGQSMQQFGMNMPVGGDKDLLRIAGPYADLQHGASPLLAAILAMKNTLDWLSGDTDLLAASAKLFSDPGLVYGDVSAPKFSDSESDEDLKRQDDEMREARKTTQRKVGISLTLLAPLLIVAYGLLRWRMRNNARMNIQLA
jgi:ABC-type uncharacterized transport system involved in gliding motility auxiliary subunit